MDEIMKIRFGQAEHRIYLACEYNQSNIWSSDQEAFYVASVAVDKGTRIEGPARHILVIQI